MVKRSYIYRLFGASPVRPLQKHMAKVIACVSELEPLFQAVVAEDRKQVGAVQKRISRLEREADSLKKDLRLHLPKGLWLPVSRRDLLEVLTVQDSVANRAKDIAGLMVGRRMTLPPSMGQLFQDYVKRSVDAARQAQETVNELDELVETGFHGSEVEVVEAMLQKLDEIESDTDRIQVEIRAALFKIERELPPVEVMFLYQIIEWIGDLADRSQRVGSRLQLMLAR